MLAALYKTKKDLKASIGRPLRYQETSMFGAEFDPNGKFAVVGPSPYERKWYASVTMKDGLIYKVNPYSKNIARKADVPWQERPVQEKLWMAGMHTAWDEPEDHPQYPYAGDIQKTMMRKSEWDAIQARRRRMYGRKAMNPAPYYGTYEYEEEPEIYCPACGGEPQYMGTLGDRDWFRCRRCGWQFAMKKNPAELAHDVVAIYEAKGERGANRHRILVTQDYDGCFTVRLVSRGVNYKSYGGFCDQDNLNNFLMNIIYDLQRKAGLDYNLVYP